MLTQFESTSISRAINALEIIAEELKKANDLKLQELKEKDKNNAKILNEMKI